MTRLVLPLLLLGLFAAGCSKRAEIAGEQKLWHPMTLTFAGPEVREDVVPNPFRDYRLDVTFTHADSGESVVVPGYFAADGNAAETSARQGDRWRVHFLPTQQGKWRYKAAFRRGSDVAMGLNAKGEGSAFDGAEGELEIGPTDKSGRDFRAKGLLQYVNGHYLRHAGNGEYFLKGGADSPENFLAYYEFDDTFDTDATFNEGRNTAGVFVHKYEPHAKDWGAGDPGWKDGKGKNIIGALNYLAGQGMNSVYFLTYNVDSGDGKDVWVWATPEVRDRFDVSKLAQWEIVFSHMDRLGLMMHVILQETENDQKLGGSAFLNPIRQLYLRELVARFAHHPALVWNLGEENNGPDPARKEMAAFIRGLDPYDHPITVHTKNNQASKFYDGLVGDPSFEATSIQGRMEDYNRWAVELRQKSAAAGRPWAIFGDEQPTADVGVLPDETDPDHDIPRAHALWGNLLGGGSGVEWYFGYKYPHMDLNAEDWRSREKMWRQTKLALDFFREHIPFWEMEPANDLLRSPQGRVFAKKGELYLIQLPEGGTADLTLEPGVYTVRWFNPRTGGPLIEGRVAEIKGPGSTPLGEPPSDPKKDWVAVVKKAAK